MKKEELGILIKERRKVLGLTIEDIAEFADLSKTTISQIERGLGNPTYGVLDSIFEYLNLELQVVVKKHK